MSGKAAASQNRVDRLGENLDEAARIFAMRVAAHRGLIQSDFVAAAFHQLYKLRSHNWNQGFGYVPSVFVNAAGINPTA